MSEPVLQKTKVKIKGTSLVKERSFVLLWIGTFFTGLSFSMFYFAEAWYVVKKLNLESSLGIIYIAGATPRIIFMLLGGVLADKVSQSKVMFFSDFTKSLIVGALVILLMLTGEIHLWTLIFFALIFGVLDAFFWPASSSIIPAIVPKNSLTRANSIIQTTSQCTSIFGPMVSGIIIVNFDYKGIFGLVASFLLLGSIFVLFIKIGSKNTNIENKQPILQSLKEGISYVQKKPVLKAFVLKTLFLNLFFTGPLTIGLPIFVKNVLKGNTLYFSLLESCLAIGMVIGSVILSILNLKKKRGIVSLNSQMLLALCFLLFSFSFESWQSITIAIFLGISMTVSSICAVSLIQTETDSDMTGRVMSIQTLSSMGLTPISYGLTSLLLSLGINIQIIIFIGALSLLIFTFILYFKIPILREVD
ncbi:MFS transporter [Bacillus pseudomycoides]|uniref:MFS transporter n=1 Tax=Bacillus pseudomycoides TaxID=64104 RepID=UPI000BEE6788|nr:MFS transporter [Bacillus pseudomycoides]PEE35256.1 MFS transporter [Bacillus pseudomycoides]PGA78641.1 MFS transporter [Bacillus pseudomycoides]PHF27862.1 MFS transporter [Bacillus pseudomycoides]